MKVRKIKQGIEYKELLEALGYTYSPRDGGYVSKDRVTIVSIENSLIKRQVLQYKENSEDAHKKNIKELSKLKLLE